MSHIQSLSTTYTGTKIYSTCPVATDTWKVYMEGVHGRYTLANANYHGNGKSGWTTLTVYHKYN